MRDSTISRKNITLLEQIDAARAKGQHNKVAKLHEKRRRLDKQRAVRPRGGG